jgi:histidinol-phosphate phosphatase family protein
MMAPGGSRNCARPRQAVILAGGRGARLRPFTDSLPKHMYPFGGRPFAHSLVEQLAGQGFERILFLLGYLPQPTREYFGSGARFGVEIEYRVTPVDWETGPRLGDAVACLDSSFLLCYCDNYWPFQITRLYQSWREASTQAQLAVYDNTDGYSRSNVAVEQGLVRRYDPSRQAAGLAGVDIGYACLSRGVIERLRDENVSFQASVYPELAARGELAAWVSGHRYYGVGTPERLAVTAEFFERRPAVLVDRDGVLNERAAPGEYVKSWSEWRWLPGACEALARLHRSGYRVIVVSNQAGIALGQVTESALEDIHARMRADVEAAGGRVDAIYVCPHHWEAGCRCRKPQPGMLWAAQRDFHLDLTRTFFLGDDRRDAQAAEAAGCLFAEVSERTPLSGYAETWLRAAPQPQESIPSCVSY